MRAEVKNKEGTGDDEGDSRRLHEATRNHHVYDYACRLDGGLLAGVRLRRPVTGVEVCSHPSPGLPPELLNENFVAISHLVPTQGRESNPPSQGARACAPSRPKCRARTKREDGDRATGGTRADAKNAGTQA